MKLLLDTHVLLWAAGLPEYLSTTAREYLDNPDNTLIFSAVSLWEIAICCIPDDHKAVYETNEGEWCTSASWSASGFGFSRRIGAGGDCRVRHSVTVCAPGRLLN